MSSPSASASADVATNNLALVNTISTNPARSPTHTQSGNSTKSADVSTIVDLLSAFHITTSSGNAATRPVIQKASQASEAAQVASQTNAEVSHSSSLLLALPAELRVVIYEYALMEPGTLEITSQLKYPGLLHSNRQVRSETYRLWFLSNGWQYTVDNCDLRIYGKFISAMHVSNICKILLGGMIFSVTPLSACHWGNLTAGCKMIHDHKAADISKLQTLKSPQHPYIKVAEAATAFAAHAESWREVERGLEAFRPLAGLSDSQWLVDR